MSLSAREQHELQSIDDSLTGSDPRLASMLAAFTRLAADEEMPVRERIQARWRAARQHRHRQQRRHAGEATVRRGRPGRRVNWQRVGPVLWLLIAVGLIAGALAATAGSGSRGCSVPSAVCTGLAPVPPPGHPRRPAGAAPASETGGSLRHMASR
jgi:hypothetical protein